MAISNHYVGGLVCQRHNEVCNAVCDLASLAWGQVQKETVVCEKKLDDPSSVTLIADVRVCDVWQSQVSVLFDVRGVDTDAPSYQSHSPQAVLRIAREGNMVLLARLTVLVSHLCAFL